MGSPEIITIVVVTVGIIALVLLICYQWNQRCCRKDKIINQATGQHPVNNINRGVSSITHPGLLVSSLICPTVSVTINTTNNQGTEVQIVQPPPYESECVTSTPPEYDSLFSWNYM